eukprot:4812517-Alexandrium_andersonii.AAC.1
MVRGAQSAIRNPLKGRQRCDTPQCVRCLLARQVRPRRREAPLVAEKRRKTHGAEPDSRMN